MLYKELKIVFLIISKYAGLFRVSRYLTKNGLRILCYHGIALADESEFRPQLFMKPETLKKRLNYLKEKKITIVTLNEAMTALENGFCSDCTTVITIDDGFYAVYKYAEIFRSLAFPVTIYVTTYYSVKKSPIFRLVVQYMFWKTSKKNVDVCGLIPEFSCAISLADVKAKNKVMWSIIRYGEEHCNELQRLEMADRLGNLLGVDFTYISNGRLLSLMDTSEITFLRKQGFEIQLHTHRHRLPENEQKTINEIADNRDILEPLVGNNLEHFCYPSGVWSRKLWPWLEESNIKTAVTCEPGFNYSNTPRFALKRFLDGENISQIEFEAEMMGYNELLRIIRKRLVCLFTLRLSSKLKFNLANQES